MAPWPRCLLGVLVAALAHPPRGADAASYYARLGRQQEDGTNNDRDLYGEAWVTVDYAKGGLTVQLAHNVPVGGGCAGDAPCIQLQCEHPMARGSWGLFAGVDGQRLATEYEWLDAVSYEVAFAQGWCSVRVGYDRFAIKGWLLPERTVAPECFSKRSEEGVEVELEIFDVVQRDDGTRPVRYAFSYHPSKFSSNSWDPSKSFLLYIGDVGLVGSYSGEGSESGFVSEGVAWVAPAAGGSIIDMFAGANVTVVDGTTGAKVSTTFLGASQIYAPEFYSYGLLQPQPVMDDASGVGTSLPRDGATHRSATVQFNTTATPPPTNQVDPVQVVISYTIDGAPSASFGGASKRSELWCVEEPLFPIALIGTLEAGFVNIGGAPGFAGALPPPAKAMAYRAYWNLRNGHCEVRVHDDARGGELAYTARLLPQTGSVPTARTTHVAEMYPGVEYAMGATPLPGVLRIRTFGEGPYGALDGFLPPPPTPTYREAHYPSATIGRGGFLEVWAASGPMGIAGAGVWPWVTGVLRWGLLQRKAPGIALRVAVAPEMPLNASAGGLGGVLTVTGAGGSGGPPSPPQYRTILDRSFGPSGGVEDYTEFTAFAASLENAEGGRGYISVAWSRYDLAAGISWSITHTVPDLQGAAACGRAEGCLVLVRDTDILANLLPGRSAAGPADQTPLTGVIDDTMLTPALADGMDQLRQEIAQGRVRVVLLSASYPDPAAGGGVLNGRLYPNEPGRPFTAFLSKNSAENFGYARVALHLPTLQVSFDVAHSQPCLLPGGAACVHLAFTAPWDGIDFGYVPSGDASGGVSSGSPAAWTFVHKSSTAPLPMEFVAALARGDVGLAVMGQPSDGGLAGVLSPSGYDTWNFNAKVDGALFMGRVDATSLNLTYSIDLDAGRELHWLRQGYLDDGTALYEGVAATDTVLEKGPLDPNGGVITLSARDLGALRMGWWWVWVVSPAAPAAADVLTLDPTSLGSKAKYIAPIVVGQPTEAFEASLMSDAADPIDPDGLHFEAQVLTRWHTNSGFVEATVISPRGFACAAQPCVADVDAAAGPAMVGPFPVADPPAAGNGGSGRAGSLVYRYSAHWDGKLPAQVLQPPMLPGVPNRMLLEAEVNGVPLTMAHGRGTLRGELQRAWSTDAPGATPRVACAGAGRRMTAAQARLANSTLRGMRASMPLAEGLAELTIRPQADGTFSIDVDRLWSSYDGPSGARGTDSLVWSLGLGYPRAAGARMYTDLAVGAVIAGVPYRVVRAVLSGFAFMEVAWGDADVVRCQLIDSELPAREFYMDPTPRREEGLPDLAVLGVFRAYPSGFIAGSVRAENTSLDALEIAVAGGDAHKYYATLPVVNGAGLIQSFMWETAELMTNHAVARYRPSAAAGTGGGGGGPPDETFEIPIIGVNSLRFTVLWSSTGGGSSASTAAVDTQREALAAYQVYGGQLELRVAVSDFGKRAAATLDTARFNLYCNAVDPANLVLAGAGPAPASALACLRAGRGVVTYEDAVTRVEWLGVTAPDDDAAVFTVDGIVDPLYVHGAAIPAVDAAREVYGDSATGMGTGAHHATPYHGLLRGTIRIGGGIIISLTTAVHVPSGQAAPSACDLVAQCPADAGGPAPVSCMNIYSGGFGQAVGDACQPLLAVPEGAVESGVSVVDITVSMNTLAVGGYHPATNVMELAWRMLRDEAHVTFHDGDAKNDEQPQGAARGQVHNASPRVASVRRRMASESPPPRVVEFTGRVVADGGCSSLLVLPVDLATRVLQPRGGSLCGAATPCEFRWRRTRTDRAAAVDDKDKYNTLIGVYADGDTLPTFVTNGMLTGRVDVLTTAVANALPVRVTPRGGSSEETSVVECGTGRGADDSSCLAAVTYDPATQMIAGAVVMAGHGGQVQDLCDVAAPECGLRVVRHGARGATETVVTLQAFTATSAVADGCTAAASDPLTLRQWLSIVGFNPVTGDADELSLVVGDGTSRGSARGHFAVGMAARATAVAAYQSVLDAQHQGRPSFNSGIPWTALTSSAAAANGAMRAAPTPPPFVEMRVGHRVVARLDGVNGEPSPYWRDVAPCGIPVADGGCLQLRVGRIGEDGPLVDVLPVNSSASTMGTVPSAIAGDGFTGFAELAANTTVYAGPRQPRHVVLPHPVLQALRNGRAYVVLRAARRAGGSLRGQLAAYHPPLAAYFARASVGAYANATAPSTPPASLAPPPAAERTQILHAHVRVTAMGGFHVGFTYAWNMWDTGGALPGQPTALRLADGKTLDLPVFKTPIAPHEQLRTLLWIPLDDATALQTALRLRQDMWRGDAETTLTFNGGVAFDNATAGSEGVLALNPAPCGREGCVALSADARWVSGGSAAVAGLTPRCGGAVSLAICRDSRDYACRWEPGVGGCRVAVNSFNATYDAAGRGMTVLTDAEALLGRSDERIEVRSETAGVEAIEHGFKWAPGGRVAMANATQGTEVQNITVEIPNSAHALWGIDRGGLTLDVDAHFRGVLLPTVPADADARRALDEDGQLYAISIRGGLERGFIEGHFYPGTGWLNGAGIFRFKMRYNYALCEDDCDCAAVCDSCVTLEVGGVRVATLDAQLGERVRDMDTRGWYTIYNAVHLPAHVALLIQQQTAAAATGELAAKIIIRDPTGRVCEDTPIREVFVPAPTNEDEPFNVHEKGWFWLIILALLALCILLCWLQYKKQRAQQRFERPSPLAALAENLLAMRQGPAAAPSQGSMGTGSPGRAEGLSAFPDEGDVDVLAGQSGAGGGGGVSVLGSTPPGQLYGGASQGDGSRSLPRAGSVESAAHGEARAPSQATPLSRATSFDYRTTLPAGFGTSGQPRVPSAAGAGDPAAAASPAAAAACGGDPLSGDAVDDTADDLLPTLGVQLASRHAPAPQPPRPQHPLRSAAPASPRSEASDDELLSLKPVFKHTEQAPPARTTRVASPPRSETGSTALAARLEVAEARLLQSQVELKGNQLLHRQRETERLEQQLRGLVRPGGPQADDPSMYL